MSSSLDIKLYIVYNKSNDSNSLFVEQLMARKVNGN